MKDTAAPTGRPACLYWSEIGKWTPASSLLKFRKLPSGWRLMPVHAFVAQIDNKERVEPDAEYRMAGVKWYGEGVFHRETVLGKEQSANYLYPLVPGAVIYNRLFARKESFAVVPEAFSGSYVSNEFPQFQIDTTLALPEYVYLLFTCKRIIKAVNASSIGSAAISRNRFRESDFLGFKVPIPPLTVQQKMVAYWETARHKASALTERANQLPHELEIFILQQLGLQKKTILKHAKIMVSDWSKMEKWNQRATHLHNQTPNLARGRYPIVRGQQCMSEVKHGCSASPVNKPTSLRVLKLSAVTSGVFLPDEAKYIADKKQYRENFDIKKGDILMCRTNGTLSYVGRPALIDQDCSGLIFPDKLMRIRCKEKIRPEYLAYVLSTSIARSQIEANARTAVGNHAIGNEDVLNFELPLPPISDQLSLVGIISQVEAEIAQLREESRRIGNSAERILEQMILGIRPVEEI